MDASSRSVVVGLFEYAPRVDRVLEELHRIGINDRQLAIISPTAPEPETFLSLPLGSGRRDPGFVDEVVNALTTYGVPEGEARFYAEEARDGRTLLVVRADGRSDQVRDMVLEHGGYDVQSRGRDLARPSGAGVSGGTGAPPIDLTREWVDVRSRYEMLWGQHYGTTDQTWEQMEPIYAFAWDLANEARYRGRPWSEVEPNVRREWDASGRGFGLRWEDAAGPIRDVWEDVADEATTGAEGGADRRIPQQGSDQSVAARDVLPHRERGA